MVPSRSVAAVVCLLIVAAARPAPAAPPRQVTITGGRIAGAVVAGIAVYRGVPFARPPVRALRGGSRRARRGRGAGCDWRPGSRRPACNGGSRCPARPRPRSARTACISTCGRRRQPAAVARPRVDLRRRLHQRLRLDAATWGDAARRGIVVVTIAYRVGALGFLAHPELTAESADRIAAITGCRSYRRAPMGPTQHRRVRRRSGRVTIAGQSAGAMSVSMSWPRRRRAGSFTAPSVRAAASSSRSDRAQLPARQCRARGEAYAGRLARHAAPAARTPGGRHPRRHGRSGAHPVIEPRVLPAPPYDVFAAGPNTTSRSSSAPMPKRRALLDLPMSRAATLRRRHQAAFGHCRRRSGGVSACRRRCAGAARAVRARPALRLGHVGVGSPPRGHGRNTVYYYRFVTAAVPRGLAAGGWGAATSPTSGTSSITSTRSRGHGLPPIAPRRHHGHVLDSLRPHRRSHGAPAAVWPPFASNAATVLQLGDPIALAGVVDVKTLTVFDQVYAQLRGAPVPPVAPPSAPRP